MPENKTEAKSIRRRFIGRCKVKNKGGVELTTGGIGTEVAAALVGVLERRAARRGGELDGSPADAVGGSGDNERSEEVGELHCRQN